MTDESKAREGSVPASEVLHFGLHAGRPWSVEESRAVLEHQLESPLAFDLGALPPGAGAECRALCAAEGLLVKSLNDLLQHPHPPLIALEIAKDFAKACGTNPQSDIPQQVATVLYYACIAAALVRCGQRLTRLTDADLEEGFTWALAQPWLTAPIQAILTEARAGGGGKPRPNQ
jgi:hypothetical protein